MSFELLQVLETSKGTFALLNAYFDDREDLNVVRISLIGESLNITVDKIHCQFWTDDKSETKPFVVEASSYLPMLPESKFHKL